MGWPKTLKVRPQCARRVECDFSKSVDFAFNNFLRVWAGEAPESVVTEP